MGREEVKEKGRMGGREKWGWGKRKKMGRIGRKEMRGGGGERRWGEVEKVGNYEEWRKRKREEGERKYKQIDR